MHLMKKDQAPAPDIAGAIFETFTGTKLSDLPDVDVVESDPWLEERDVPEPVSEADQSHAEWVAGGAQ